MQHATLRCDPSKTCVMGLVRHQVSLPCRSAVCAMALCNMSEMRGECCSRMRMQDTMAHLFCTFSQILVDGWPVMIRMDEMAPQALELMHGLQLDSIHHEDLLLRPTLWVEPCKFEVGKKPIYPLWGHEDSLNEHSHLLLSNHFVDIRKTQTLFDSSLSQFNTHFAQRDVVWALIECHSNPNHRHSKWFMLRQIDMQKQPICGNTRMSQPFAVVQPLKNPHDPKMPPNCKDSLWCTQAKWENWVRTPVVMLQKGPSEQCISLSLSIHSMSWSLELKHCCC